MCFTIKSSKKCGCKFLCLFKSPSAIIQIFLCYTFLLFLIISYKKLLTKNMVLFTPKSIKLGANVFL